MGNRSIVYTALIGSEYQTIPCAVKPSKGWEYVCLTGRGGGRKIPKPWKKIDIDEHIASIENQRLASRVARLLGYRFLGEDVFQTLCVHHARFGNNNVSVSDLGVLLSPSFVGDADVFIPQHHRRRSVMEELKACDRHNNAPLQAMMAQYDRYKTDGFKDDVGLFYCAFIYRRHFRPVVDEFSDLWYRENERGTTRDMLSCPYVFWKLRDRLSFPQLDFLLWAAGQTRGLKHG